MTRVEFYILQDVDLAAAHRFACRLAAKAVSSGARLHLHVDDADTAGSLDELLWSYPEGRFVPHEVRPTDGAAARRSPRSPVTIGWDTPPEPEGMLVNLAGEIPGFFGRFDRVAEIVVDAVRSRGRERYKFYRDRGYPLHDHHLDDWETS